MHWLDNRELVPMIRSLRDEGERARRHAVERALKHLGRGEDPRQVLDFLSHSLTNKLLHPPTHALSHASTEDREELVQWLARLYRLPPQQ
jgi:glutamyl-tRNA reductase